MQINSENLVIVKYSHTRMFLSVNTCMMPDL